MKIKLFFILIIFSNCCMWADSEESLWLEGEKYFSQKKFKEAILCFEKITENSPQYFDANYQLYLCHTNIFEHRKALEYLEKATNIRPSYGKFWELGNLGEKYNEDALAARAYTKALEYDKTPRVYQRLSIVLDALGKSKEAWKYRVQGVELELPELRGYEIKQEIIAGVKTRSELEKFLVGELDKEITPEKAEEVVATLLAFGMIKERIDLKEMYTALLTEQIGGFYNPETKRLYLIEEKKSFSFWEQLFPLKRDDAEERMVLAHEMTHAIQDQYYDLLPLQKNFQKDDDMSMAITSLIEGDATLAMMDYNIYPGRVTKDQEDAFRATFKFMSFLGSFFGGKELAKAPSIIREGLMAPYIDGFFFCLSFRDGVDYWENINKLYQNPPKSTEQILHPSKYKNYDAPLDLTYNFSEVVSSDWTLVANNVMGEFGCRIVLKENKVAESEKIAEGWGGDRYFVFKDNNENLALVWLTVWDTPKDATEFSLAYQKIHHRKKTSHSFVYKENKKVFVVEKMPDITLDNIKSIAEKVVITEK